MTRKMAARMVREGTVVQTPEELDAWIARTPEAREVLERGGYNTQFTANDLFPLLQVFIEQVEGPTSAPADPQPRSSTNLWIVGLVVLIILVILFVLVTDAIPSEVIR